MSDIVERLRMAASNNRAQAERGTTTTGEILTRLRSPDKRGGCGDARRSAALAVSVPLSAFAGRFDVAGRRTRRRQGVLLARTLGRATFSCPMPSVVAPL